MKQISTKLNFIVLIVFAVSGFVQAQEFNWSKAFGGLYPDRGDALTTDSAGNIYMTGETFSPSVDFGNGVLLSAPGLTGTGNCEFFLTKFDAAGKAIWTKKGGGALTDRGYGVVIDNSGNIVVAGHYMGAVVFDTVSRTGAGNLDAFVAKYDTAGNILWFRDGKDASQSSSRGIAYDNNGNTAVVGYFGSSTGPTITFDNIVLTTAGLRDIFLVKYNTNGIIQWGVSAGGTATGEEGKAITCDASGNIYITGMFVDTASFGNSKLIGNGNSDIFVAKYNPLGQLVWAKSAGGPKADIGYSIGVDKNENVYVCGNFDSLATFGSTLVKANGDTLTDGFVTKLDKDGNFQWVMSVGGQSDDVCSKVLLDGEGNCLVFGNFRSTALAGAKFGNLSLVSTSLLSDDVFIMKVSSSSELLWVKQTTGADLSKVLGAVINAQGNILVEGYFRGYLKVGSDSLVSVTSTKEDIFLSEMGYNAVPVELTSFSANFQNGMNFLSWSTATEKNNYGFEVERSSDKISFTKIAFVKGNGTVSEKCNYSFSDGSLNSDRYYYRLKQIDFDGTSTYSQIVEANAQLPKEFALLQNYPNPFNPETNISFTLPAEARVTLQVFNVLGELVETLINKELNAGKHSVVFDASKYVSGVFFYKLNAVQHDGRNNSGVKKMIVAK